MWVQQKQVKTDETRNIKRICRLFVFFRSSAEWEKLDADGRKKLGLDFDDDGEFWLVHCGRIYRKLTTKEKLDIQEGLDGREQLPVIRQNFLYLPDVSLRFGHLKPLLFEQK